MLEQYFKQDWQNYWRPYNAMKCASLMRETLWSMVSEIYSKSTLIMRHTPREL